MVEESVFSGGGVGEKTKPWWGFRAAHQTRGEVAPRDSS